MRWRVASAECGLGVEPARSVLSDGVRAGVDVADETEGGGVGLFRRPPVRERKAVKIAWVEERRSGVRGTWSDGGDMRLGGAAEGRLFREYGRRCWWYRRQRPDGREKVIRVAQAHRVYHGCWAEGRAGGQGGAGLSVPICCRKRIAGLGSRGAAGREESEW